MDEYAMDGNLVHGGYQIQKEPDEGSERKINRVMFAGTNSGCGKTTITCGIMQALLYKGLKVSSFKCGPDYIDPMFHSKVIGTKSSNLDSYFTNEATLKELLYENSLGSHINIMEGVMGYYDGIGLTEEGSAYSIATATGTPVILIIDAKGMSTSLGAIMEGFLHFRKESNIKGVIFNRLAPTLYDRVKKLTEDVGIKAYGYLPAQKDITIESRHLGLVTADELADIKDKLNLLGTTLTETIDLEGIIALAKSATPITTPKLKEAAPKTSIKIGVAKDKAFCFYYRENLKLLEKLGAELVFFSPLECKELPKGIRGLYLGGGYPELYGRELSENKGLLTQIKTSILAGLPTIAECGGFMYLHEELEDKYGQVHKMAEVIPGKSYRTERLKYFGYIKMHAREDSLLAKKGEMIKAHEFHYWDSDNKGSAFHIEKAAGDKEWEGVHVTNSFYGGYPHLYFYSNPLLAERFIHKCSAYGVRLD